MGWWQKLLNLGPQKPSFRSVDWLAVEGKLRGLEAMSTSPDQATAKQLLIQSDILVGLILNQANVPGQTLGEQLKTLRGRMENQTYHHLWQAHNKRNELVHESGSFVAAWEKDQYFRYFKAGISALRGVR
jgi:hypothetical protein